MFFPLNFGLQSFDARRLHPDAAPALEGLVDPDPVRQAMLRTVLSDPNGAVEFLTGWLLTEVEPTRARWMLALLHQHPILELRTRAHAGLVRVAAESESAPIRQAAAQLLADAQDAPIPRERAEHFLHGKPRRSG
ncbi:MAG: hypothetical protein IPG45_09115 [Deltaproteobacteria bacterium]|jgi:hypothetical protein|nr:hypothetical protein [Deltaproteobacteria bacterium]